MWVTLLIWRHKQIQVLKNAQEFQEKEISKTDLYLKFPIHLLEDV